MLARHADETPLAILLYEQGVVVSGAFATKAPFIFELLFRAGPTRRHGPGVGLAVVKLLIEQSGGSLTVNSDVREGTTFVAVLPRYDIADYLTE